MRPSKLTITLTIINAINCDRSSNFFTLDKDIDGDGHCAVSYLAAIESANTLLYVHDDLTLNASWLRAINERNALTLWNVQTSDDQQFRGKSAATRLKIGHYILHVASIAAFAKTLEPVVASKRFWQNGTSTHFAAVSALVSNGLRENCTLVASLWKLRLVKVLIVDLDDECATYVYDPFAITEHCREEWRNLSEDAEQRVETYKRKERMERDTFGRRNYRDAKTLRIGDVHDFGRARSNADGNVETGSKAFNSERNRTTIAPCVLRDRHCRLDDADCLRNDSNCLSPVEDRAKAFAHLADMKEYPVNITLVSFHFAAPYLIIAKNKSQQSSTSPVAAEGLLINPLHLWSSKYRLTARYFETDANLVKNLKDPQSLTTIRELFMNGTLDFAAPYPYVPMPLLPIMITTKSFLKQQRLWLVPKPALVPNWTSILNIYSLATWCYMLVVYLAVAAVWWLSARLHAISRWRDLSHHLLDAFRIVLGASVRIPSIDSARLLLLIYILFTFHVNYIFQGIYSSLLTVPQHEKPITNVADLLRSRLTLMVNKNNLDQLGGYDPRTSATVARKIIAFDGVIVKRPEYVRSHGDRAITVWHDSMDVTQAHKKYVVDTFTDTLLRPIAVGYTMRDNSPFLESLDRVVDAVEAGGLMEKWKTDYERFVFLGDDENRAIVLRFDHVRFAFVVLMCGLIVAVLAFITELITFRFGIVE